MPIIRMPHLTRRQQLAVAAGVLVFALAGGMERADALPISHHVAEGGLTPAVCTDFGTWSTTLTIDGTFMELHPVATITNYQSPIGAYQANGAVPLPYSHTFIQSADIPSVTFSAHVVWDDGFNVDVGPWTATRPNDCPAPTPQTVAPPPPPDTSTTLAEVATTVAVAPPTTAPLPSTTMASAPPSSATATTVAPVAPPATLPATGIDWFGVTIAAGVLLLLGILTVELAKR